MPKKKFALDYGFFVDFERYTERMTYNENDIYFASDYVIRLDDPVCFDACVREK